MRIQRYMSHHLLIGHFISFCTLYHPIKEECSTPGLRFGYQYILKKALFKIRVISLLVTVTQLSDPFLALEKYLFNLQAHCLARP